MATYISDYDAERAYDDMLDDVYPEVSIAGMTHSTSYALKEIDPIAYRVGFDDWLDSEGLTTDEREADSEND